MQASTSPARFWRLTAAFRRSEGEPVSDAQKAEPLPVLPVPFPTEIPFLHDLGVEFLGMGEGEAQVALNLAAKHMNSWQAFARPGRAGRRDH